ncbi:hypothetical protein BGW80DRAFT_1448371 [Lactifluus volemus]|nr:hypothetical protein BGW80DRAFT_1448371 [Lactifluus volemus]
MVFSPAKVIFAGIGVLLMAAKDVGASQDALVDLFDRIETFFQRLEIYIKVRVTEAMKNLVAKIMAEIIGILAIATKEIRQGWGKRYLKKLTGRTDIEDALTRLEKLSNDEALTATVQVVDVTQQIESDIGDLKQPQIITGDNSQEKFQTWLSPPDPSINYNTARDAYHNGTSSWFTQGRTFQDWKNPGSGSLFWIHGKAGSGKSILSSAIIHDLKPFLDTGPSYMAYFFFDFKDTSKQDIRALQTSLLIQLCGQSNLCIRALSTYIPSTIKSIGAPRSRQKVLEFLKELVELHLPNLHICVTSRPEFDIRHTLEQLTSLKLSLQDEDGQKQDIAEYVRSVVYSDNELVMKKWRQEIKDLVIKVLSEKADGMYECQSMFMLRSHTELRFRWVVCQLETLRECLARNVERVLSELPESLDETYLRVLKGVKSSNREDVYRLLQCLVVAVRPLRVEELAEVLAVNFDHGEGIPKLNPDWRWEDQEEALQAACSSLIAIVDTGNSRVVQFSHFSVKEFLTSSRLSGSSNEVSRYHISLEPAHTILAQSCLGVLLRLPVDDDFHEDRINGSFPLVAYAARYWIKHAQFKNVASHVSEGMELLFDPNKPHFSTPETKKRTLLVLRRSLWTLWLGGAPHCWHHQDVNVRGGYYVAPLGAALAGKHLHVAKLLYQHGANVDVPGKDERTLLRSLSLDSEPEIVRWLLECGAETNARDTREGLIPLHVAALRGNLETVQILVQHNADINAKDFSGKTPLHYASERGHLDVVRLLLGSGADVNARMDDGSTPLHVTPCRAGGLRWVIQEGNVAVASLLLKHGADIRAVDNRGRTAFEVADQDDKEMIKLLSEHIAKCRTSQRRHFPFPPRRTDQLYVHKPLGSCQSRKFYQLVTPFVHTSWSMRNSEEPSVGVAIRPQHLRFASRLQLALSPPLKCSIASSVSQTNKKRAEK